MNVDSACFRYEIRDDRAPTEIKIKVGRAVQLVKRLDQWSRQCTSKEVILRGWWPGTVEDDDGTNGTSLLRGRIIAGEKGPYCHRLERLVHLELADLAVHAPYLEPGFPNVNSKAEESGSSSTPSTPGRSPKPSKVRMPSAAPCIDCKE
jgi:Meiotically up-regulated gene 113